MLEFHGPPETLATLTFCGYSVGIEAEPGS